MAVGCKDCTSCPNKQQKHEVEIAIEDIEFDYTNTDHRRSPLKQAKIRIRSITPPRCRDKNPSSPNDTSSLTDSMGDNLVQHAAQPLTPGGQHHLWLPQDHSIKTVEPTYHLKLDVLKETEWRGDCPTKKFAFKSLHHLTYAINRLEADFKHLDIRKCGVDGPDAMGGRVNDERTENITIDFRDTPNMGWQDFLALLTALESEWEEVE